MFARTALLTALVLSLTTADVAFAEPREKSANEKNDSLTEWLPRSAFEENPRDDELNRLLKERYRTAAEEVAARRAMIESGVNSGQDFKGLGDAVERVGRAALELCQTSPQRIAVLEKVLDRWKENEAYCKELHESGINPAYVLLDARYQRLEAEIALAREKRNAAKKQD